MKKLLFFGFLLFTSVSGFSQNSFFVDKKGIKTLMKDGSFDLLIRDERLAYVQVGKKWDKYIRFKDLDYALIGSLYFKSFKLINAKGRAKKESAYFVLAETKDKKLLSYTYTVTGKYTSIVQYNIYVIDNNNNILDYVELNHSFIYKGARMKISPMINKHFSDCPELISEYSKFPDTDEDHLNILGFFDSQKYIKCE